MIDQRTTSIRETTSRSSVAAVMTAGTHGCSGERQSSGLMINAIPFRNLVERYEQVGFIYPAKRQFLQPHWAEVEENWQRTSTAPEPLRRTLFWQSETGSAWACVDLWRSAVGTWWAQHLVADGGGGGSVLVMLDALAVSFRDPWTASCEAWYRPTNSFANRVFGGVTAELGTNGGHSVQAYLRVPPDRGAAGLRVRRLVCADGAVLDLARARNRALPVAADLVHDPELEGVDRLYRGVGLRRYRRIFLATDRRGRVRGAALAHRGPTGMNFSFLENRCDLLLAADGPEEIVITVLALISAVGDIYTDFRPGFVPVTIAQPPPVVELVSAALGAQSIQSYAQAVWLRAGTPALSRFFDQTRRRSQRGGS